MKVYIIRDDQQLTPQLMKMKHEMIYGLYMVIGCMLAVMHQQSKYNTNMHILKELPKHYSSIN